MNQYEKRTVIALFCICTILVGIIIVYAINANPPASSPYKQAWPKLNENHTTILSEMQSSYNVTDSYVFALEVDLIMTNSTPICIDLYMNGMRMIHLEDFSGGISTAIRLGPYPSEVMLEDETLSHGNITVCFFRQDQDVNVSFRIRTWVIVIIYHEASSIHGDMFIDYWNLCLNLERTPLKLKSQ